MTHFKPIPNSYIVGNPIKTREMFYGRKDDFAFIKRKLELGTKSYIIIFCGERRSGKTSILFQILNGELGEKFLPILIDMQTMAGLKNDSELFDKITREVVKAIPDFEIKSSQFNYSSQVLSAYRIFDQFLDHLQETFPEKTVLFLIDEYEIIESKIAEESLSKNFITYLAGLLEGDKRISFVFTGSKNFEERDMEIWHVLFGKSLYRNVSFLSRKDTFRLIQEPVKDYVTYDNEVLLKIYRLTAGQPFYTQVVCQNIVDRLNEVQKYSVNADDLDHVVNEILENPLPQMIYFWNSLSDNKKLILSLMSDLLENSEQTLTAKQIQKHSSKKEFGLQQGIKSISTTLESLFHARFLKKEEGTYNFQMDLFRRWIQRDHSIWQVIREIDLSRLSETEEIPEIPSVEAKERKKFPFTRFMLASVSGVVVIILIFFIWQFRGSDVSPPPVINKPTSTVNKWQQQAEAARTDMERWERETRDKVLNATTRKNLQQGLEIKQKAIQAFESGRYEVAATEFQRAEEIFRGISEYSPVPPPTRENKSFSNNNLKQLFQQVAVTREKAQTIEAVTLPEYQKAVEYEKLGVQNQEQQNYNQAGENYREARKLYLLAHTIRKKQWEDQIDSLKEEISIRKEKLKPSLGDFYDSLALRNARVKEQQAGEYYQKNQFASAFQTYHEANALYDNVLSAAYNLASGYRERAESLKIKLASLQSNFAADLQYLPEYQQAVIHMKGGETHFRNGVYKKATAKYTSAEELFQKAEKLRETHFSSIQALIISYLNVIEEKNTAGIQEIYPKISAKDMDGWIQFFKFANNIVTSHRFHQMQLTASGAIAQIEVKIEFDGNRGQGEYALWDIYLYQTSRGWRILNIPKNK